MTDTKMTDATILNFGKYKGKMLGQIPAHYLLWFEDQLKTQKNNFANEFRAYVEDNRQALNKEIEEEKRNNKFY